MSLSHEWPWRAFNCPVWGKTLVVSRSVALTKIARCLHRHPSLHDAKLDSIVFWWPFWPWVGHVSRAESFLVLFTCFCFCGLVRVLHQPDSDMQGQTDHESDPDKKAALEKSVITSPGTNKRRDLCRASCLACRPTCFSAWLNLRLKMSSVAPSSSTKRQK